MAYDQTEQKPSAYSKIVRAGKRRTYFFDLKESRANDYYLIITESRKRFDNSGYDKSKLFVYKEDFNKFENALLEVISYAKTELMPNFNFDEFNHEHYVHDHADKESLQTESEIIVEKESTLLQESVVEDDSELLQVQESLIQEDNSTINMNTIHINEEKW